MIELAAIVVAGVLIVGVVAEAAEIILRHQERHYHDGRTKH